MLLRINDLHTIAQDDKNEILKGLDLEINKGEVHVIMGPNGSGKTTSFKCFSKEIEPDEGSIIIGLSLIHI